MSRMRKLRFFIDEVLFPKRKAQASLGSSEEGKRSLQYFNKRSWRKGFLRNKRYNCAVLDLAAYETAESYRATVKGKNSADYFARRCEKLGYTFRAIAPNDYWQSIYEINHSAQNRQGKAMGETYLKPLERWPDDAVNQWYGVFDSSQQLVAYLWSVHMNDLVLINRILGHDEHLKNNVMYLLSVQFVSTCVDNRKARYVMYDTFGRSDNGLAMFKRRIGFERYRMNFTA
jgi:hypothetical protein